ncbi:very-long-chain acyl-CoA dehydrogenase [Ophiocordyceps sinensis CO18]|uniref:Very-long-chain acyl-CoA dehydrogenase n=1 Tax=Ophiocordyceps sinensis (strain Co18 / CGMCC 3.14243) TaxID=911162 RepID=T5AIA8_OPHSC|nr:very-long-chain acyl-CoA dehydrogenase [Ophiocordyceps sinensis CO18]
MQSSSSADRGFFQKPPVLVNQFHDDVSYRRCFQLFLPADIRAKTEAEVASLGQAVLADDVFAWITDAERNKPYVKGNGRDVFGRRAGELITPEGWRELQNFGISKGMVACGYDTPYGAFSRPLQFLRTHLWVASCANVGCPSAMQDGAASLLRKHLTTPRHASQLSQEQRRVLDDAYRRLTSRDPSLAWTSGQWMTERPGGSDVSQTETRAIFKPGEGGGLASKQQEHPLGPWSINGFKWFSSATDCRMVVLLAQTSSGLSAFFAPLRKHDPSATTMTGLPNPDGECLNGVYISRLKNKFGTQSLPTAELVLEDMRGWLLGQEGKGIHEISSVLNLTRIHSALGAVGGIGRGLGIARAYARVRQVGSGKGGRMSLLDSSLHMRTLAKMTAEYHGLMLLSFFATYILGLAEHPLEETPPAPALAALTPRTELAEPLLRVLTQLTKAYVCKASDLPRPLRRAHLGGDDRRAVHRLCPGHQTPQGWRGVARRESLAALDEVMAKASAFEGKQPRPTGWHPDHRWAAWKDGVATSSPADLVSEARELVWGAVDILVSALLYVDAGTDGDPAAADIFHRFLEGRNWMVRQARGGTEDELRRDQAIVYGIPDFCGPKL